MPWVLALFTRLMPAASSGASSPLSAASAASLRIDDILIMMEDEPRRRSSKDIVRAKAATWLLTNIIGSQLCRYSAARKGAHRQPFASNDFHPN